MEAAAYRRERCLDEWFCDRDESGTLWLNYLARDMAYFAPIDDNCNLFLEILSVMRAVAWGRGERAAERRRSA
jgi:hypothetical protein